MQKHTAEHSQLHSVTLLQEVLHCLIGHTPGQRGLTPTCPTVN